MCNSPDVVVPASQLGHLYSVSLNYPCNIRYKLGTWVAFRQPLANHGRYLKTASEDQSYFYSGKFALFTIANVYLPTTRSCHARKASHLHRAKHQIFLRSVDAAMSAFQSS